MIDLSVSNDKLMERAICILFDIGSVNKETALKLLKKTNGSVKLSLLIALSGLGATGRGIDQAREDVRFDAANRLAQEPRQRLTTLQSMLGMLPSARASTVYRAGAGTDPIAGLLSLLRGGRLI